MRAAGGKCNGRGKKKLEGVLTATPGKEYNRRTTDSKNVVYFLSYIPYVHSILLWNLLAKLGLCEPCRIKSWRLSFG